jgi:hypothetical protein
MIVVILRVQDRRFKNQHMDAINSTLHVKQITQHLKSSIIFCISGPFGQKINFLKTRFIATTNSWRIKHTMGFPITNNLLRIKKL